MNAAASAPGRLPATSAAITQRLRTRLKQRRFSEAASDLALLRKNRPRDHAIVEASLAYAIVSAVAGGRFPTWGQERAMNSKSNERVLCLSAAAKRLNVPERTLRHRASRGRVPGAFKQGKLWKFRFPIASPYEVGYTHMGNPYG